MAVKSVINLNLDIIANQDGSMTIWHKNGDELVKQYAIVRSGDFPEWVASTPMTAVHFRYTKDHGLERLVAIIAFEIQGVYILEFENKQFREYTLLSRRTNVRMITYRSDLKIFTVHHEYGAIIEFQQHYSDETGIYYFHQLENKNNTVEF